MRSMRTLAWVALAALVCAGAAQAGPGAPSEVWVDDDYTATTPGWGVTRFDTIQKGINAVAAGGTVNVTAGTYVEDPWIGKSLALVGPNATVDPNTGSRGAEALIRCGGSGDTCLKPAADDITVSGFTFSTTGWINIVPGAVDGLTVTCNIFTGGDALYTEGSLSNVTFSQNRQIGGGTCFLCTDIDGATISDNVMQNMTRGLNIGHGTTCRDVTISDNTFDTNSRYAIQMLSGIENVTIADNDITNTSTPAGSSSYGIVVAGYGFVGPLAITGNHISAADLGLFIADTGVLGSAVTVTGNTFDAYAATFIYHAGTGTLTALADLAEHGGTNTYAGAADDQAIETKVVHDVDAATLGHVDWGRGPATVTSLRVADAAGGVGDTVQLTAKLTADGKPLAGQSVTLKVGAVTVGSGTTDAAGVAAVPYVITSAGTQTITAKFRGVFNYKATTATATLTAAAATATGITLTVTPASVASGQTATCTVVGNNGVDYTDACTYYVQNGAGGSWADNVYTAGKAGTWTVTAVYNTLTDTAALTVTHGTATGLTLTPATATINSDGSQAYTVTATDAGGNTWTPDASCLAENGAGSFTDYTYNAAAGDAGNVVAVTATVDGQAGNATLNVNAVSGPGTILAWDKDTRKFYLCSNATDPETGTEITGTGTFNGIACTVTAAGSTNVTVTAAGASLRVAWYLRSGALYRVCEYSTGTASGSQAATYYGGRTLLDGAWQTGYWGLTHTIIGGVATLGSAAQ